ncbi:fibronectin type III domain-containing protein [Nocardioides marmoriginsengisoli]|uniref:fibronectin type III domain-containing protein n=1 Tax=Nocardioides marmoriginsengisoli TaxID=661483 RepID=UPI0011CDDF78|nr:fibronectin type III domain-containing protein [Nocardioides marmoriginsengisoli]
MRRNRTHPLAALLGAALVATLLTAVPSQAADDPVLAGELVPASDGPGPAVDNLGISGDTIAASWGGLPGVWTRPWVGGTWTKTYGDALYPLGNRDPFEFSGGVLGTTYGNYLVPKTYTFAGGQRTVPLGTGDTYLARGGTYTVRGPGNSNRWYVDNTRTGAVVGGPYPSFPIVDGRRAWTQAGTSTLVADDLAGGPTHTVRIADPCTASANLNDVRGRWLLFGCDGGFVVVDVAGQLPKFTLPRTRGTAGLGYGYAIWDAVVDDPENAGSQMVAFKVRSLTTGETRAYGPIDASYNQMLRWDGASTSRAVYRDKSYQVRKVDLSWAAGNPEIGARQVTGVRSSYGDRGARVTWAGTPANLAPVSGYQVTVQPGGRSVLVDGSARSAEVTGLRNGVAYRFTVTATDAYGVGQPSTFSNTVVPAGKPGTVTPRTKRQGRKVIVTWTAPDGNGRTVLRYLVKIDTKTRIVSAATLRTVFKGVKAGKHRISVRAVTAAGTGTAKAIAVRVPR